MKKGKNPLNLSLIHIITQKNQKLNTKITNIFKMFHVKHGVMEKLRVNYWIFSYLRQILTKKNGERYIWLYF
jgi:hypothetical protein